ncbi:MAG: hypothetical protein A2W30_07175 [Ignavibacteria bacterium RBG_16_36_9]|nr:MAG: hypothetical protein A2W30_07175 [Ignavibacteria bacterium RBG_16_36_9]
MKTKTYLSFIVIVFLFASSSSFAQDSTHGKHSHKHDMEMKKDTTDTEMKQDTSQQKADELQAQIVREGEIDLQSIDKNKDGKVFQDQMDWNVISDEPGECPLCGMTLKECTLQDAKANLVKHGFKVVDN